MRKVRRDILKTINKYRSKNRRHEIFVDPAANEAANEFAQQLLQSRAWNKSPDDESVEAISQLYKLPHKQTAIVGYSNIDEESGDLTRWEEYLDAHGAILEIQEEREKFKDRKTTHVGLGFASDGAKVVIVELLS